MNRQIIQSRLMSNFNQLKKLLNIFSIKNILVLIFAIVMGLSLAISPAPIPLVQDNIKTAHASTDPFVGFFSPELTWTSAGDTNLNLRQPDPRNGDLMIATIAIRPAASTVNTPSGWTLLSYRTGTDGGSESSTTGSVGHYIFYKVANGSEGTANVTFTENGTTSVWNGSISQVRSATGTYNLTAGGYSKNGNTTNFGGTLDNDIGLTAGDLVLMIASTNGDTAAHSGQNITATGITSISTVREHGEYSSTTGNDIEQVLSTTLIWAGTNTATPTVSHTLSVAASGTMNVIRIRQGSGTNRTDTWVRSAGAQVAGTTSVVVPYPEHNIGDRLILVVGNRYSSSTPTTPTNWTLISNNFTGGSGSNAADSGTARISAYYRDVTANLTGTVTVTISSGNTAIGQMFAIHKDDVTGWIMDDDGGADNTAGTSWSVTGSGIDLSSVDGGDLLLAFSSINTDSWVYSNHSMSASGITFGDVTQTAEYRSATGNDMTLLAATGRVTGGTATNVAPTYTATASGSATSNPAGAVLFVAIRGQADPVIDISGTCKAYNQTTDCGDTGTIAVAVNGALRAQTQPTVAGTWTVTGVTVPSGAIVTVFIDGAIDSDEAAAVFKYDGSGNVDNVRLYKEHVTIGTDGGLNSGQTITVANMGLYDVGNDEDVFYRVMTSGTCEGIGSYTGLCVDGSGTSSQERLTILPNNTFTAGANVISNKIEVLGTLSGTDNITITGGYLTGNGTVNMTGGTVLIDGTGNFGGNTNWTFNNLTLGDGVGSSSTTATGSGNITITNSFSLASNQTFYATAKTYILSKPFNLQGVLDAGTSTFRYIASVGQVSYNHLRHEYSTMYWGTSNWTSGSFTPTAGKRLLVILGGMHQSSIDVASSLTLSDSQGLTWTSIGSVNNSTPWTFGAKAFLSSVVPSSTSTTVTASTGGLSMAYYAVTITEVSGANGTVTGFVSNNNMNSDGPESLTLSQTPAAGSLGVFMKWFDEGTINSYPTMSSGWDLIAHFVDSESINPISVAVRQNMTGTTVSISDMSTGSYSAIHKTVGFAFAIEPSLGNITAANYYNLELVPNTNNTTFVLGSGTFNIANNLTIGNGSNTGVVINADINDPIISIGGDLIISANSSYTSSSSSAFTISGNLTNSGTFNSSNGSIIFNNAGKTSTITGSNTFHNFTVTTAGKAVRFTAGTTTTITGLLTVTGGNGNNVTFNSNTGSSSWTINHQGTENITYLTVSYGACHNSSTSIDMTGTGNTNGGNNGTCWDFGPTGITISGIVYQSDGSTIDPTGYTVSISNGGGIGTTTTSNGQGEFTFTGFPSPNAGNIITIWLSGSNATLVFRYGANCSGSPNCTGLSLVRGQVRLQSFDGASISNSHLSSCDNNDGGFGCNDATIGFDSDGTHLTIDSGRSLYIAPNTTFAPGGAGNVITPNLIVDGTYTASTGTLTVSGNLKNNGTFTAGSGTVAFNNVALTSTVSGSITFNNLTVTTAGKKIRFTAGETFGVNGALTLTGSSGLPVDISSTTGSSSWTINYQGTQNITYAKISWAACHGSSASISLGATSYNGGNNGSCWLFILRGGGGSTGGGAGSGSSTSGGGASGGSTTATATATVFNGVVTGFVVVNGGSGYSVVPTVLVCGIGGIGSGAAGTAVLSGTSVASITLDNGGSGYSNGALVTIASPADPTGVGGCGGSSGGGAGGGGGGASP